MSQDLRSQARPHGGARSHSGEASPSGLCGKPGETDYELRTSFWVTGVLGTLSGSLPKGRAFLEHLKGGSIDLGGLF